MVIVKVKQSDKFSTYAVKLNDILDDAAAEVASINAGNESPWPLTLLNEVVIPEMTKLLNHAQNEEVLFEYGMRQRMLQSVYFILESLDDLHKTPLGSKIMELQELYRKL